MERGSVKLIRGVHHVRYQGDPQTVGNREFQRHTYKWGAIVHNPPLRLTR